MMSTSTAEQLHAFHAQDRAIFTKLVLNFSRPPAESLLVMATWLWLEDFGFEHIFSIIIALTDPLIASLADEAVSCFECLGFNERPANFSQIPLTAGFMTKDISLELIYAHKYSAIVGIKNFLNTVCSRIFSDILQRVLPSSSSSSYFTRLRRPLNIPGFPHRIFWSINVMPHVVVGDNLPNNNLFFIPNGLWGWNATCTQTENDRTTFLTFSRGFPVSEEEATKLFTELYGENCVLGIYMPQDRGNSSNKNTYNNGIQQSLFARMVLDSVTTVDRILIGQDRRKFLIYKKHVWVRKYEERLRKMDIPIKIYQ